MERAGGARGGRGGASAVWAVVAVATAAVGLGGCATARPPSDAAGRASIQQSVDAAQRPAEDRARDADRRPADVLAFLGLEPGMQVADLMAGKGYYTEILARAVGPDGRVVAQNNAISGERHGAALRARLADGRLPNVVELEAELEALDLGEGRLDMVVMGLFYHDLYWMGVDRPAVLRVILHALAPGGVFGLFDHHAAPGSGARDVKTLHRVEEALVVEEVLAAGFELEATSDLLRHPEDDRTSSVFDEALRGRTDRFLLRFRKPR